MLGAGWFWGGAFNKFVKRQRRKEPSWGTLASLGHTHPPELLTSFGPLASCLWPSPTYILLGECSGHHPHDVTQIPRHFLNVIPTRKPQQLLWTGSRQPYWVLKKGQGFCLGLQRLPDPSPLLTRHSDVPTSKTHGSSDSPTEYLPITSRAGVGPVTTASAALRSILHAEGGAIILASFLLAEEE